MLSWKNKKIINVIYTFSFFILMLYIMSCYQRKTEHSNEENNNDFISKKDKDSSVINCITHNKKESFKQKDDDSLITRCLTYKINGFKYWDLTNDSTIFNSLLGRFSSNSYDTIKKKWNGKLYAISGIINSYEPLNDFSISEPINSYSRDGIGLVYKRIISSSPLLKNDLSFLSPLFNKVSDNHWIELSFLEKEEIEKMEEIKEYGSEGDVEEYKHQAIGVAIAIVSAHIFDKKSWYMLHIISPGSIMQLEGFSIDKNYLLTFQSNGTFIDGIETGFYNGFYSFFDTKANYHIIQTLTEPIIITDNDLKNRFVKQKFKEKKMHLLYQVNNDGYFVRKEKQITTRIFQEPF